MATEIFRTRFLRAYREFRDADLYLSNFFETRPENIFDGEKVKIDIVRGTEDISPIVNTLEGPTYNTDDQFVTKEFVPPNIQEGMPFDARELLKRQAGQNEYEATDTTFQAALLSRIMSGMNKLENKIRRNKELQASQILQTGILTLKDKDGNVVYTIDYQPKATHFTVAGIAWDAAGGDPFADIIPVADAIRTDSLRSPNLLIMGDVTVNAFMQNPIVQLQMENRRMDFGRIQPGDMDSGGKFWGTVNIGQYFYEIWSWDGQGVIPGDVASTQYVDSNSCIVMSRGARLDTVFGGVPMPVPVDPRFAGILPGRVAIPQAVDMAPNIYSSLDGTQTILSISSRPLLIPTAIDTFGRIDSGV